METSDESRERIRVMAEKAELCRDEAEVWRKVERRS